MRPLLTRLGRPTIRTILSSYGVVMVMPGGELGRRVARAVRDVSPSIDLTIVDQKAGSRHEHPEAVDDFSWADSAGAVFSRLQAGDRTLVIIATAMYGEELLGELNKLRSDFRFDVLDYPTLARTERGRFATREYVKPKEERPSLDTIRLLARGRADVCSWLVFARRNVFWATRRRHWIRSRIGLDGLYVEPDFTQHLDSVSLLDAGAFDGDSVRGFVNQFAGRLRAYVAVEPLSEVQSSLQKRLGEANSGIFVKQFDCALGSEYESFVSLAGEGKGAYIKGDVSDTRRGERHVRSRSISAIEEELGLRFNFMKFDIEGAELSALQGIRDLPSRHGTVLAISVYHSREQLREIARWLCAKNVQVSVALRHYGSEVDNLVLYVRVEK